MNRQFKNLSLALLVALSLAMPAMATAPTDITVQTPVNVNASVGAGAAKLTLTAADVTNGNSFTMSGTEEIIIYNSDSGSHTVTLTSIADAYGRTGNITTYAVPAGEIHRFGPFPVGGWKQTNGKFLLSATDATVKFAIVRL